MPWMWVTANDPDVCLEYCEPLHGVIFERQEDAPYQPGDAHPNCRCIWQYVPPTVDVPTAGTVAALGLLPFWGDGENEETTEPPVDIWQDEPLSEAEELELYGWLTGWSR